MGHSSLLIFATEGFWGDFKFSIPGFFLGRKIWQVFFGDSLIQVGIFGGIQINLKISWWCPRIPAAQFENKVPPNKVQRIISFSAFKKILRLVNSTRDFFGVPVWSSCFFCFDFCLLKSGVPFRSLQKQSVEIVTTSVAVTVYYEKRI